MLPGIRKKRPAASPMNIIGNYRKFQQYIYTVSIYIE